MSWLSSLTSGEGAAALTSLVKQAVSSVESSIDKVLDIQPAAGEDKASLSGLLEFGSGFIPGTGAGPASGSPSASRRKQVAEQHAASQASVVAAASAQPPPAGSAAAALSSPQATAPPAQAGTGSPAGGQPAKQGDFFADMLGGKATPNAPPKQAAPAVVATTGESAAAADAGSARSSAPAPSSRKRIDELLSGVVASKAAAPPAAVPATTRASMATAAQEPPSSTQKQPAPLSVAMVAPIAEAPPVDAAYRAQEPAVEAGAQSEPSASQGADPQPSVPLKAETSEHAESAAPEEHAHAVENPTALEPLPNADTAAVTADDITDRAPGLDDGAEQHVEHPASDPATALAALQAELISLHKTLSQRETQLLNASQENAGLLDQTTQLKTLLVDAQHKHAQDTIAFEHAVAELRARISELESQVAALQAECAKLRHESGASSRAGDLSRALAEKEESIRGLLAEGENLAKEILKANTTVKKLRARESELDKEVKDAQKKLESATAEISVLKEKLAKVGESEQSLSASVQQLTKHSDQQVRQVVRLEKDLSAARDKCAELQVQFESVSKELEALREQDSDAKIAAQSEALEKEVSDFFRTRTRNLFSGPVLTANVDCKMRANQEVYSQLEQVRQQAEQVESALRQEIFELRASLLRSDEDAAWKEETLREEIQAMQMRLQAAESRNEDLSVLGQDTTKPLMRQIDLLQAQHSKALKDWEAAERSLTKRLYDAEAERSAALENERLLKERLSELSSRVVALETQNTQERQDRSRLTVDLETERGRAVSLEKQLRELNARLGQSADLHAAEMARVRQEAEDRLEAKLQEESANWEARLKTEQRLRQQQAERLGSLRVDSRPRLSATSLPESDESSPPDSASSSTRFPPGTTSVIAIERLQATIKQNESQIASLQLQLRIATQNRDDMANELVRITNECDELTARVARGEQAEQQLRDLEMRHNTALEMLGEKTERVLELEADIDDMKAAFKAQIESLLAKSK